MNIMFLEVDKDNWIECIKLTTNSDGKHTLFEEFVASNAVSIAQSKAEDSWITKVIYDGSIMVGFIMYGYSNKNNFFEVCRIMIDYKQQGKGYGKKALEYAVTELRNIKDCKEIFLSFDPENKLARYLYEKFGFKDTGKMNEEEVLFSLKL